MSGFRTSGPPESLLRTASHRIPGAARVRWAAVVLVVSLLAGLFAVNPTAAVRAPPPSPASFAIDRDYDLSKVADIPSTCGFFAARVDGNDRVHYAYVAGGRLYYGVEGLGPDPIVISSGFVACADVDLAFKPDGTAVVAWIDLRNSYASGDGSGAGWDLFVASEDTGWQETLVTASSNLRVQTFRMGVDSRGTIDVVYSRFTVANFPYDPVLFFASSPQWQEVAISGSPVWYAPSLAIDSRNRVHVAWFYSGNLETVWYATSANGWANVRVDQNQSSNWWDDRRAPSIALDTQDGVHVVWDDFRDTDTTWTLNPNRVEIWDASPSDGWVNRKLVVPDDAAPTRTKWDPILTIESTSRWHVVWSEGNDNGSLYYANSTDWNRAIKFTNASSTSPSTGYFPPHPVDARSGRPTVVFADSRTGSLVLWRKNDWDFGPDLTPPIAGPVANRTFHITTGGWLHAIGSWDNDRIVSYDWRFVGPTTVVASGHDVFVTFAVPGRYEGTLSVQDPAGYQASTNFTIEVVPEPSTTGWILDRRLMDVPGSNGKLVIFPWDGTAFPILYWGAFYLRVGPWGNVLQETQLKPDAPRETGAVDGSGNVHTVGFDGSGLVYTKASPAGVNLIPPTSLALGGVLPQRPYLTFADDALWLAWIDQRDAGGLEIYMASLDLNGSIRWGPVRISNSPLGADLPIVSASGSSLWVVWTDSREFAATVYASRLNLTTMAFGVQEVRLGDGAAWDAKALGSGGIAWLGGAAWGEPYLAWANATGAATAPTAWPSLDDGLGGFFGALAVDSGDNAYAVWWDGAYGNASALRYAKASPNGSVEPLGGVRIHDVLGSGGYPTMSITLAPDGEPRIAYAVETPPGFSVFLAARDPVPPVARISIGGTLRAGAPIVLDGRGSTDNSGVAAYAWSVRDPNGGTRTYNGTPVTIREHAGSYTVTLTVRDLAGNTADASSTLTVAQDTVPPVAVIAGPMTVTEGDTITYDGTGSPDDGAIETYHWSVTGPQTGSGEGPTFRFAFPVPGNYTVHLLVTDFGGNSASTDVQVRVRDLYPPTVVLNLPATVYEGDEVTLDASRSTDESGIGTVVWSVVFGGTEVARLQGITVRYRFERAGSYQVTATVADVTGNEVSRTVAVTVLVRAADTGYRTIVGLGLAAGGAIAGGVIAVLIKWRKASRRRGGR